MSSAVLEGLGRVDVVFEGCREMVGGVGEGSWLKSKRESASGSKHWLVLLKFDGMVIA